MKPLESHFIGTGEVKGYKFCLMGMTNRAFIYEVDTGDTKYYEVFRKKENHRYGCISYPSSRAFGIYGWTYSDLRTAIKKYNQLNYK